MNRMLQDDISQILADANIPWQAFDHASFFITGATGLLGSLIAKTLIAYKRTHRDLSIYALVRSAERAKEIFGADVDQLRLVIGDVRDPLVLDAPIDYIFHGASVTASKYMVTNPVETVMTSIRGTENVFELARRQPIKGMVYLSSMEVYGTTAEADNPVTEEKLGFIDLRSPRSSYPESKRICECMCGAYSAEYGVPVRIARLAQTFGAGVPLSDNRVSMQFARSALRGEDIVLHTAGKSVSNFCYTVDAVRGLFTILTKGENGQAYNICNDGESRTIAEIAELVATRAADKKIQILFDIPEGNTFGYAPDAVMRLNSDKLRKLAWRPQVSMVDAYKRLISYLKEAYAPDSDSLT
ncbi:MAG: NAD-dependent epimerase/dehydratase family protein [Oscillospiraceae bacterium]